jgi:serine/threonine protein kinase
VDPLIGKLVNGRYLVQEVLGQGGMGKVYVAEQIAMKRQVALKVIRVGESGEMAAKMAVFKRFQQEALASSRLEHHNTVRVFDFGITEDGTLFIAMELLRGTTLSKIMCGEPMPSRRAIRIAVQLCRSLAEAHQKGIIHRDLKPDNVMVFDTLDQSDFVKLLDFGIAKITAVTGESEITRTGLIMGTPAYMAPEQATAGLIGPGTDLYALGVILYEALTGHPPFTGGTPLAVLMKHVSEEVPPIVVDGFPPDVPQGLIDIVFRLLEKKASNRPASAMDVAHLLENVDFAGPRAGGALNPVSAPVGSLLAEEEHGVNSSLVPTDPFVKTKHLGHVDPVVKTKHLGQVEPAVRAQHSPQSDHVAIIDPFEKTDESTGSLVLKLRRPRRLLVLVGVLFLAVLMVGAALWLGAGVMEPVSQTAPAVKPTSAAVAPVVSPEIAPVKVEPVKVEPAKVEPIKVESVKVEIANVEPVKVVPAKVKPEAVKVDSRLEVRSAPKKPSLPRCVRSKCPFTGDCVDKSGARINGASFCDDLAI